MKKLVAVILTAAMILTLTATAFATAADKKVGEDTNINVTANYTGIVDEAAVYSVDVTWTSTVYTYTATQTKDWNPATHTYDTVVEGAWGDVTSTDVTVVNHSNKPVTAQVTFASNNLAGVNTQLSNGSAVLAAGVVDQYDAAASLTATLSVSGEPEFAEGETTLNIGTITVALS